MREMKTNDVGGSGRQSLAVTPLHSGWNYREGEREREMLQLQPHNERIDKASKSGWGLGGSGGNVSL